MEIRWSPEAANDLTHLVRHIALDNERAARRVAQAIFNGVGALTQLPNRGRVGRVSNTRELIFAPLPYVVIYRVHAEAIEVARVLHGAQRWP